MIKTFIDIHDSRWKKYKIDYANIVNIAIITALQKTTKNKIKKSTNNLNIDKIKREVSIILTNDFEIQKLNKKYRNINKPTNVLSFETGDIELMGDIYISFDTTMHESKYQKDFIEHVSHLIVHGVLHLFGYDHLNKKMLKNGICRNKSFIKNRN